MWKRCSSFFFLWKEQAFAMPDRTFVNIRAGRSRTRRTLSQFWSLKIRRTTFLNYYIKFDRSVALIRSVKCPLGSISFEWFKNSNGQSNLSRALKLSDDRSGSPDQFFAHSKSRPAVSQLKSLKITRSAYFSSLGKSCDGCWSSEVAQVSIGMQSRQKRRLLNIRLWPDRTFRLPLIDCSELREIHRALLNCKTFRRALKNPCWNVDLWACLDMAFIIKETEFERGAAQIEHNVCSGALSCNKHTPTN